MAYQKHGPVNGNPEALASFAHSVSVRLSGLHRSASPGNGCCTMEDMFADDRQAVRRCTFSAIGIPGIRHDRLSIHAVTSLAASTCKTIKQCADAFPLLKDKFGSRRASIFQFLT